MGNVLAKIDRIQVALGQTLTERERTLLEQKSKRKGLAEVTDHLNQQQRQNADGAQSVHGRSTATEGELGEAEQEVKFTMGHQERVRPGALARQNAHVVGTSALRQQVQKLIDGVASNSGFGMFGAKS